MPDLTPPTNRPNILWVFGDQHRAQACGYRGDPNVNTPNLDRLAREGCRFDNAVAGAPWCCPFRAALVTGRYPHQVGVPRTPSALDPSIPTIASPLRDAGYHTAYFGKWHLDGSNLNHYIPPDRRGGFDHWIGSENLNRHFDSWVHGDGIDGFERLDGFETDAMTTRFIDYIDRHFADADEQPSPFFGVLSVTPPHPPYFAPEEDARRHHPADVQLRPNVPHVDWVREQARGDIALYSAMVENLDRNLGRIREALRRLDIDRNTIIVFFSDHGEMHGSHGQFGKSTPYEESLRIPLIIGGTLGGGCTWTGATFDSVVNHVDLYATTLGLAGAKPPPDCEGHDYSDLVLPHDHPNYTNGEDAKQPDSAFCQQIVDKHHSHSVNQPWRAVVTRDRWKYAAMPGHDWLMFDLNVDPYEQMNLAFDDVYKEKRTELHQRLAEWIDTTGDEFDLPPL